MKPKTHTRKKIHLPTTRRGKVILAAVALLLFLVGAVHIVSLLTTDRTISYTEIEYASGKVSPQLDGYVIAFVTDTHAISRAGLEAIVQNMNARGVDLLLLGGDFPTKDAAWRSLETLCATQTTDGIYGVEGNHDDWENLCAAMEHYGATPLDNGGRAIRPGLYLAGVQDLWNRSPDVAHATENAKPEDFVLLLCHNPDVSMQQDMAGVDLMLSGHTHGGHVTLFGVFKPLLYGVTHYGHRFGGGWATGNDGVNVYVSRGVGATEYAPRVFAQPEVVYITLRAG